MVTEIHELSLQKRMALNTAVRSPVQPAEQAAGETSLDAGLNVFSAEFYTEHRVISAELTSPEARLSDHLNSSAASVDLRPHSAAASGRDAPIDLTGSQALLAKDRLLFVIPVAEPTRPNGTANPAWKSTSTRRCWAGLGPYKVVGTVHTPGTHDTRIALRLLDKQFLPLTGASITFPDGSTHDYGAIIINRSHVDLFALQER